MTVIVTVIALQIWYKLSYETYSILSPFMLLWLSLWTSVTLAFSDSMHSLSVSKSICWGTSYITPVLRTLKTGKLIGYVLRRQSFPLVDWLLGLFWLQNFLSADFLYFKYVRNIGFDYYPADKYGMYNIVLAIRIYIYHVRTQITRTIARWNFFRCSLICLYWINFYAPSQK